MIFGVCGKIDNSILPAGFIVRINMCKLNTKSSLEEITIMDTREMEKKEQPGKEECKPLTEEEFKEYQKKDARTTKKVLRFFKAIWEAINFFS